MKSKVDFLDFCGGDERFERHHESEKQADVESGRREGLSEEQHGCQVEYWEIEQKSVARQRSENNPWR